MLCFLQRPLFFLSFSRVRHCPPQKASPLPAAATACFRRPELFSTRAGGQNSDKTPASAAVRFVFARLPRRRGRVLRIHKSSRTSSKDWHERNRGRASTPPAPKTARRHRPPARPFELPRGPACFPSLDSTRSAPLHISRAPSSASFLSAVLLPLRPGPTPRPPSSAPCPCRRTPSRPTGRAASLSRPSPLASDASPSFSTSLVRRHATWTLSLPHSAATLSCCLGRQEPQPAVRSLTPLAPAWHRHVHKIPPRRAQREADLLGAKPGICGGQGGWVWAPLWPWDVGVVAARLATPTDAHVTSSLFWSRLQINKSAES